MLGACNIQLQSIDEWVKKAAAEILRIEAEQNKKRLENQ
jgi:hypothetical protein